MKISLIATILISAACVALTAEPKDGPADPDEEWKKAIQLKLERKISFEFVNVQLDDAARILSNLSELTLVLSPKLNRPTTVDLKCNQTELKDALAQFCKLAGAEWEVRNEAIFICPSGKALPPFKKPEPHEAWEAETLKKLSRNVSLDLGSTPFSEAITYLNALAKVNFSFDPKFENADKKLVSLCPIRTMRMDDALTWLCFLADADWTFKKSADGIGQIVVVPISEK